MGRSGALFISEADKVYTVMPNPSAPALATVYAAGVPGTNGLGFDGTATCGPATAPPGRAASGRSRRPAW